jgi:hypothetical protein
MLHFQEALFHLITLSDYLNCIVVCLDIAVPNIVSSSFSYFDLSSDSDLRGF